MLALFAAVSLYATDLNIYASGLKVTTSGGATAGIQYTLNAPATSLDLKILDGTTLVSTIAIPAGDANANFSKGTHNVNIDISALAEGSYNWAIVANGATSELAEPALVNDLDNGAYQYYLPQDVVVDNNFESPYFGRIYVGESMNGASDGGTNVTKTQTRGIYIYNADLTLDGQATALVGHEGGLAGSGRTSFRRLAVDEAGYVYVCSTHADNLGVYRMNPANPGANFETVLAGKAVHAIEVVGNTLYTLEDIAVGTGTFNAYDITTIPAGEATSSVSSAAAAYIYFANEYTTIRDDKRGGQWLAEFRGSASYNFVVHLNALGEQDFVIGPDNYLDYLPNFSYRGTLGLSPDGNIIAIGSQTRVRVFNITYGAEGPSLALAYEIVRPSGGNTDGVAFDRAGNLYVLSASSERFYVYAMPKAVNSFETPAPSTSLIVRSATITHVTGISLDQTSASVEKGHTLSLVATVVPGDATNPAVTWTSSDDEIASVSSTGVVMGVAEGGPVTITATTEDGGLTASCQVTVFVNHVTEVVVDPATLDLAPGFRANLTATVLPDEATDKSFIWESSDPEIATVVNGLVTAIAVGDVTITATANDGGIFGSCAVSVHPAVAHISAWGLAAEETAAGYTFSFNSNMDATAAAIVFFDKVSGIQVGEVAATVVSGANAIEIAGSEIPGAVGEELTWGVRLTGEDNAAFSKVFESDDILGRLHLVVDASPESPYMGQTYVFARNTAEVGGMYVIDQQNNISSRYNFGSDYKYGFMRPSIDETGKVWAADWCDGHSGIWIVDPATPNACTQFFQGTPLASGLYKIGDVEVGGSSPACFVYGKGENRKLFTVQEDFTDASLGNHPVAIYEMGTAYTWDAAPTAINVNPNNPNTNNGLYAVEDGYWVSQNRSVGQNTAGAPALQFFGMDGTLLANFGGDSRINGCSGAGFTINPKNGNLFMVDGSSNILEFEVAYDAESHVPTLTLVDKIYVAYANISSRISGSIIDMK